MNAPIFILGCHKSGSSLLRSLLDGHSALNVLPIETHFFEHLGVEHIYPLRKGTIAPVAFKESLAELIESYNISTDFTSDAYYAERFDLGVLKKNQYQFEGAKSAVFENMCQAIYDSLGVENWDKDLAIVEKSVENFLFASFLRLIFPECRFLHIIRNPYANLVSLRTAKRSDYYPSLPELVESVYLSFRFQVINSSLLSNYLTIRYEDLLSRTKDTMLTISEFLNLPFEDTLLRPTSLRENWFGNSSSRKTFEGVVENRATEWQRHIEPIEVALVDAKFERYIDEWAYQYEGDRRSKFIKSSNEGFRTYFRNRSYSLFSDLF